MTVLVTAAGGHLGRATVHALLARGTAPAEVVATARDLAAIADLADLGVQTRRADYGDRASLDAALTGADRVLLVSGNELGSRLPQHTAVIEAAVAAGVSFLAYTSAPHADTAGYLIAQEHRGTEQVLAASGLPHAVLRNGWYHENYTGTAAQALAHGQVIGSAGDGRVSAAARQDLAEAAAVVLTQDGHEGRVYELGGEPFTLAGYAAALGEAAGTPVTYVDLSEADHVAALVAAGVPAAFAGAMADSDQGIRRGELLDESGALARLLGRPTTPLADSLRAALA